MSLRMLKPGILDTIQDMGRGGYGFAGMNHNGPMDWYSAAMANALAGNDNSDAFLEMSFPAATIVFEHPCTIAICGADFMAVVDKIKVPLNRQVTLPAGSTLSFSRKISGEWVYLAVKGGFTLPKVLQSYATNIAAGFGGFEGRTLKKDDLIPCRQETYLSQQLTTRSWFARPIMHHENIRMLPGPEFEWLELKSQDALFASAWKKSTKSNRMGIALDGKKMSQQLQTQLISSPVALGTVQLLPDGSLVVLAADSQTTGGYPRVLQVIAADISALVQKSPGTEIHFEKVTIDYALHLLEEKYRHLKNIQFMTATQHI